MCTGLHLMVTMTTHCRIQTATIQGLRNQGAGGGHALQFFLADQLALSELGGQIMSTTVLLAPPGFSDIWWLQWEHIVGYKQHQQWCFLGNFNQWLERPNRSAQWKILTFFFQGMDFLMSASSFCIVDAVVNCTELSNRTHALIESVVQWSKVT